MHDIVLRDRCAACPLSPFERQKIVFLVKGDLHAKASTIKWLGIEGDRIGWGKLALISGILISTVTFIATILTVAGFKMPDHMGNYINMLPVILIFAFLNSLFESIVYRNGILGTLCKLLPKEEAILVAAVIFGMGHYYGAPDGIVGVLMSTLLGWYMGRSVQETKGMAAAWLIHFMRTRSSSALSSSSRSNHTKKLIPLNQLFLFVGFD